MDGETSAIVQGIQREIAGIIQRLDKLEGLTTSVQDLALTVREMVVKQGNMEEKVDNIDSTVKEINGKPGKRWDTVVMAIITGVLAILLAALVTPLITK